MIYGKRKQEENSLPLPEVVEKCLQYAEDHNLTEYSLGKYNIDGEKFFFNIVSYETAPVEQCFWEAHRQYLDIHLMLSGSEQIDLNFIQNMKQKDYVLEDDFISLEGCSQCSVILKPGDYLLCDRSDCHRTAVAAGQPQLIKKAIFKVQIATI